MRALEILLERNVLNVPELQRFAAQVAAQAPTPAIRDYVGNQLLAFLKKRYDRVRPAEAQEVHRFFAGRVPEWASRGLQQNDLHVVLVDDALRQQVEGVIDWLGSQDVHGVNLGRMPFEVAMEKSVEWHRRLAHRTTTVATNQGGTEVIRRYPNRYTWNRLLTPDALDHEGDQMGHCVGRGSYDDGVAAGTTQILSLRDPNGGSHVTVEIRNRAIQQVKGRGNKVPVVKYRMAVIDLLNNCVGEVTADPNKRDLKNLGIFRGAKGFGDLLSVAEAVEDFDGGYRLADMGDVPDDRVFVTDGTHRVLYLTDPEGAIIAEFECRDDMLEEIQVKEDVVRPKAIRHIVETVVGRFDRIDHPVVYVLHTLFGIHLTVSRDGSQTVSGRRTVDRMPEVETVAEDLLNRVAFHRDDANDPENPDGYLFVLDRSGHPLLTLRIARRGGHLHGRPKTRSVECSFVHQEHPDPQWTNAIPLVLEALRKLGCPPGGALEDRMRQAGWLHDGETWRHNSLIDTAERIHATANGTWIRLGEELLFQAGKRIVIGLIVKSAQDTGPWELQDVIPAYRKTADDHAHDTVDLLLSETVSLPDDYSEMHFLLDINVWTNGDHDFEVVDWDEAVDFTIAYSNTRGDGTQTITNRTPLGTAIDTIGIGDDPYILGEHCLQRFFRGEAYTETRSIDEDDSSINENPDDYYDDPEGYLKATRLKHLPLIAREEMTLRRLA